MSTVFSQTSPAADPGPAPARPESNSRPPARRDPAPTRLGPYVFKRAETPEELEQVHRLNYRTFVREIGQHPDNGQGALVDKFHDKNLYFIGVREGRVIAMISTHDRSPFSVADRLEDPSVLDELEGRVIEVRLLAIEPEERHSIVFPGLLRQLLEHARTNGYTHLVISGVAPRESMYTRLGFEPLGPAVRCGEAEFIPMILDIDRMPGDLKRYAERLRERAIRLEERRPPRPVSLLPGPVQIAGVVQRAMREQPESHRGDSFLERYERVRSLLSEIAGGRRVGIFCGSGTLANEVVAATLAADETLGRGLVLNNGEFGRRLAGQATRHGLDFATLTWSWGRPWDLNAIDRALRDDPSIDWIWAVHLETSTGVLNDLDALRDIARARDVRLCLDCVSSLGAVETELEGVHLASGVSGKALGSLAGFAFVFAGPDATAGVQTDRVPTYLDLDATLRTFGPRFTCPSLEMLALDRALEAFATPARRRTRYAQYAEMGRYVRERLREIGLPPLAREEHAAPIITTFAPPEGVAATDFCRTVLSFGYEIAGFSGYLQDRGLVQIATMGAVKKRDCADCLGRIEAWVGSAARGGPGSVRAGGGD